MVIPPLPEIDSIDRRLAQAALRKRAAGKSPTRDEQRALRRVSKAEEERQRWEHYSAVPKKHYRQMAGRQTKTLNEQAERFGIPIGGATIDLSAVLRWLHDFLAAHRHQLQGETGDPLLDGASQALKDEYVRQQIAEKREKALLARYDRLEREESLRDAAAIRELLGRIAGIHRGKLEALGRLFGPDAVQIINEGWNDAERIIDDYFSSTEPGDEQLQPADRSCNA